ncbi:MAG: hypothetical protein HW380_3523 [Magnetococcales bacterium]|nr:hypothetical protein [Magnetococcales bacterium]
MPISRKILMSVLLSSLAMAYPFYANSQSSEKVSLHAIFEDRGIKSFECDFESEDCHFNCDGEVYKSIHVCRFEQEVTINTCKSVVDKIIKCRDKHKGLCSSKIQINVNDSYCMSTQPTQHIKLEPSNEHKNNGSITKTQSTGG